MWKLLIAFIVLAVAAVFALKKAGGGLDMSGEKHGAETPAAATAPAATAPASAASN